LDRRHAQGDMLCSEIVNLHLQGKAKSERKLKVNLEEIWLSGALFQADVRIHPFTCLWFVGGGCEFRGQVIEIALHQGLGYFIEMRFDPSCTWSEQKYQPKHLFNPLVVLANRIFEETLNLPSDSHLPATFARAARFGLIQASATRRSTPKQPASKRRPQRVTYAVGCGE
jgi:hypothetical protein